MNKAMFKNALIVLLLTITGFSVFKYSASLKEKYGLLTNLSQVKEENLNLIQQKQNLLQDLEKEKGLKVRSLRESLALKEYLRSGKARLSKLFKDYSKEQGFLEELNAKFSLLKAENASLLEEKQKFFLENEALKQKLGSLVELKKAIRELKQNMRKAQVSLTVIKQAPEPISQKIVKGNHGYLIKDGKFNSPNKVVIEVIPAPQKE